MNVFVISCVYSKGIIPKGGIRAVFLSKIFLKLYLHGFLAGLKKITLADIHTRI